MSQRTSQHESYNRDIRQWIIAAVLAVLILACLVAVTIGMGTGVMVDGERVRVRFESAVTNYPFCPPEIPCPISMVLDKDHWVVWVLRDRYTPQGVETTFQKMIDIPLW